MLEKPMAKKQLVHIIKRLIAESFFSLIIVALKVQQIIR